MNNESQETRELIMNFDKTRLYSLITMTFRCMRIPNYMFGSDLLTGVIFGKIRHPEITVKEAVENSVEASKLPGSVASFEEGLDCIIETLEVSSEKDLFYAKTVEEKEKIIQEVIDVFLATIRKNFCYEVATRVFENEEKFQTINKYSIGAQAIKSMLFKKLYAPDSTFECMKDYAINKISKLTEEEVSMAEFIDYVSPFITGSTLEEKENSLKKLLVMLEQEAYEKFPSKK